MGAFETGATALTGAGEPETIHSAAITPSCFALFGIRPIAGRVFQGSPREVVIGRGLWMRKWQMNPAVVGQAIALDGVTYTIAGVADLPRDLLPGAELVTPLLPQAAESRSAHEIEAVGRAPCGRGDRSGAIRDRHDRGRPSRAKIRKLTPVGACA